MRKWYYAIAAVVLVLLISIWGYFQYQKQLSFKITIHQKTDILYKVDTHEVVKKMLTTDLSTSDSLGNMKNLVKSIEIPANIFIYNVEGKKKTTFFGSIKIKDYSLFEGSTEKFNKKNTEKQAKVLESKDGKWTIIYNKNDAVFSYSYTREKVTDILEDILYKKNMQTVKESIFKDIVNKKGQIVFFDGINEGFINLDQSSIKGQFLIDSKKIKTAGKIENPIFNKNNIISFWLQADLSSIIAHKSYTIDSYRINTDSLLSHFRNEIQLEIAEPTIQKESVITYEFDDNFEKVEVVEVKETVIPGLSLQIKSDADKLYSYLQKQKIITNANEVSRKFFPLYKMYATKTDEALVVTTRKKTTFSPRIASDTLLYLRVNFDKMRKQEEFSDMHKYIQDFQIVEMNAHKLKDKIQFDLDLEFIKDSKENPILSFLKKINKKDNKL